MPIEGETPAGRRRRLQASQLGSKLVSAEFAAVLSRKQFAKAVGISPKTLRRWEAAGVVRPRQELVMNSPTAVFRPEDIDYARRVIRILREESGTVSLAEAAKRARKELSRASG